MTAASSPLPSWLDGGRERCSLCFERYVYELEVRCSRCDEPLCRCCAAELRVEARIVCCCPDADEAEDD